MYITLTRYSEILYTYSDVINQANPHSTVHWDPPHAAIAMGRLACRVREQDSCTDGQKWLFFTFRLKIRYILFLRRSAPPPTLACTIPPFMAGSGHGGPDAKLPFAKSEAQAHSFNMLSIAWTHYGGDV